MIYSTDLPDSLTAADGRGRSFGAGNKKASLAMGTQCDGKKWSQHSGEDERTGD